MLLPAKLPELALVNAQKALEIAPQLPLAHFLLGEVYLYKSNVAHALEEFEKERAINPGYAPTYDRLGDVYTRTEKYHEAQEPLMPPIPLATSTPAPYTPTGTV